MKIFIKGTVALTAAVVVMAFAVTGCSPLNSLTVGKNNVNGLKSAIDCKPDEALQSLKGATSSDIGEYRRIGYQLTAAVFKEQGQSQKFDETVQGFKNDPILKDKDEKTFLYEVGCFEEYFKEQRLKKTDRKTCG
jgi:hypothetical protein